MAFRLRYFRIIMDLTTAITITVIMIPTEEIISPRIIALFEESFAESPVEFVVAYKEGMCCKIRERENNVHLRLSKHHRSMAHLSTEDNLYPRIKLTNKNCLRYRKLFLHLLAIHKSSLDPSRYYIYRLHHCHKTRGRDIHYHNTFARIMCKIL